jgi:hypothetical protein
MNPRFENCRKCGKYDTGCTCKDVPFWVYIFLFTVFLGAPLLLSLLLHR